LHIIKVFQNKQVMKLSITILVTSCIVAFVCFISCTKEATNPVTRQFDLMNFNKIEAGDDHEIIITQGAAFSVQARGNSTDLDEIRILVNDGTLKIGYPYYNSNRKRLHIIITMPVLTAAEFAGAAYGKISGFQQPVNFRLYLSGNSKFEVNTTAPLMDADVSGTAKLVLHGTAGSLVINVSGQAELQGYDMGVQNVFAKTSGQANAYINTGNVFTADASGQSRIFYKGQPATKNITETGMARVIRQ
jgi:hypothetical protein